MISSPEYESSTSPSEEVHLDPHDAHLEDSMALDHGEARRPHLQPVNSAATSAVETEQTSIEQGIERACALVPPLWTLRNFVAVNPFLGLTQKSFGDAIVEIDRIKHGDPLFPADFYRKRHDEGRILEVDIDEAIAAAPTALGRPDLVDEDPAVIRIALFGTGPSHERIPAYSELVDLIDESDWSGLIVEEIGKWCAARFDRGQSSWPQPYADRPLYAAWRELAKVDRSPEIRGLSGFRAFVGGLPSDPEAGIAQLIDELGVPDADLPDLLARELATVSGWAGHLQYRIRQAGMSGEATEDRLCDLLAIRLAFDVALKRVMAERAGFDSWANARDAMGAERLAARNDAPAQLAGGLADLEIRHIWQLAFESSHRRQLVRRVTGPRGHLKLVRAEKLLQAAFCIDVRSEPLRRHLEASSDRLQTIGFAGFFGLAIETIRAGETSGEPRCPALLAPAHRVTARDDQNPDKVRDRRRRDLYHKLVKQLRLSTVVTFPFVETVGQFFGFRLMTDALGWTRPGPDSRLFAEPKTGGFEPAVEAGRSGDEAPGIPLAARIDLAEGMLRNMGLTKDFAPYVLLCGHGSTTTNNPYGSALDCGACGGYSGDINARAAALLVNDPAVREALIERGIDLPAGTRFVAGLHDTTTDEIRLFDTGSIPVSDLATIQTWLDQASAATRAERAPRLGLEAGRNPDPQIRHRSRDWSELRPEWGLAGNAAFIAAPRDRTYGLDLEGRCFLHDYHADRDPDGQVLELILTAPLVVASWINLQYFGSTVDNEAFGSGSKTIHNVVGRHGVISGNGGDLRVGLPFQSVHDGERFVHEPLRLTALIEAPKRRIETILSRQSGLRELVENQWIHLMSIEPDGDGVFQWTPNGFQKVGDDERKRQ